MKITPLAKLFLPLALLTCCATSVHPESTGVAPAAHESIEWCDIWISHANETGKPRVLLIGDSITRGYYPQVEKHLAGKAFVGRLSSSAFISDPVLIQQIQMVLGQYKFDVIHFNNGMHGWQHSEQEYDDAFPKFLAAIQAAAPGAKLIWANTTTLKVSPDLPAGDQTKATDERIAARNAIALKYIKAAGIEVDDLNSLTAGHPEYHTDNVHFNDHGIALQADQVARQIQTLLP
jgi:lysophospholipase L1-like esterase